MFPSSFVQRYKIDMAQRERDDLLRTIAVYTKSMHESMLNTECFLKKAQRCLEVRQAPYCGADLDYYIRLTVRFQKAASSAMKNCVALEDAKIEALRELDVIDIKLQDHAETLSRQTDQGMSVSSGQ
jgi:hypothetical protein